MQVPYDHDHDGPGWGGEGLILMAKRKRTFLIYVSNMNALKTRNGLQLIITSIIMV